MDRRTNHYGISRRAALGTLAAMMLSAAGCDCDNGSGASAGSTPTPGHEPRRPEPPDPVNGCAVRLESHVRGMPLYACQVNYVVPPMPVGWPAHTVIHPDTHYYRCGRPYLEGRPNAHDHDPAELALCADVAEAAGVMIAGVPIYLSEATEELRPFYIAANRGSAAEPITADSVRKAFNGTIYPRAMIVVEPLAETGKGWSAIACHAENPKAPTDYEKACIAKWRAFMAWMHDHPAIHHPSFVMISGDEIQITTDNGAACFPRMVIGVTQQGSLVGVCGYAVHT